MCGIPTYNKTNEQTKKNKKQTEKPQQYVLNPVCVYVHVSLRSSRPDNGVKLRR